jgi:hypothetical protein
MGTKRVPLRRELKRRITPEVLDVFATMENIECTCPDDGVETPLCKDCEIWNDANTVLRGLLKLRPWWWPTVDFPDEENPYPPFTVAAQRWRDDRAKHPERVQLYRDLRRALDEREKQAG